MEQDIVITLLQKMFVLILEISTPVLLVGIVVGLRVSIFQTITQIQESTLTIVPKIIAGVIALIVLMPWMMSLVIQTTNEFFDRVASGFYFITNFHTCKYYRFYGGFHKNKRSIDFCTAIFNLSNPYAD